jgi:hypothetical protein
MTKTKTKAAKPAKNKAKPAKKAAKPTVAAKKAAAPKAAKAVKGKAPAAGKVPAGKLAAKAGKNGKAPAAAAGAKKPARVRVRICKAENCENPQTTQGFCRLHYLSKWKEIREEKLKRAQKNLDRYVERMAGAKKPAATGEDGEETEGGQKEEAVFEEDFGEFVDVLSREENLDKILNGIKVEDY